MVDPCQIRAARALLGWSQQDLARRSGVSRRTVTTIENDDLWQTVGPEVLEDLVAALMAAGILFTSAIDRRGVSRPTNLPED